ncbi:hypothetical protein HanRHA438_Chr15g0703781 [Helianthus annuus]|nr:hypothetical protein HanRHA438_Chr15g0703781 [Helianthus annuus]
MRWCGGDGVVGVENEMVVVVGMMSCGVVALWWFVVVGMVVVWWLLGSVSGRWVAGSIPRFRSFLRI